MSARRAAWLALIVTLSAGTGALWLLTVRTGHGYDFGAFHAAAEAVRAGRDPYVASPGRVPPYVYPPVLAQAVAALPPLTPESARRRLALATVVAVSLALGLTLWFRVPRTAGRDEVAQGQVNGLALLAIALAVWLEGRGRPAAAGWALAPAVVLKLTPLTFALWWVARRRLSALAGLAAGVTALVLVSLAVGGAGPWASYLGLLRGLIAGAPPDGLPPLDAVFNFSLAGFCARLLPASLAGLVAVAIVLTLAFVAGRAAARAATPAAEHGALLAVLALAVMAPPLSYRHHVILVFPALLLVLADTWTGGRRGRWQGAALLLGLVLASVNFPGRAAYLSLDAAGGYRRWLTSLNLYGLLVLFAVGVLRAAPTARPSAGADALPAAGA
jgi:glycosyl transferase family 87